MTTKEKFINELQLLIDDKKLNKEYKVLTVWIESPDMPVRELISNRFENLAAKKTYYDKAYDDDLHLKANSDIFISGYRLAGQITEVVE